MPPPLETNSGGLAKDMTLRDWFAGQALAGLLANKITDRENVNSVSEWAYATADALLIERERGE